MIPGNLCPTLSRQTEATEARMGTDHAVARLMCETDDNVDTRSMPESSLAVRK